MRYTMKFFLPGRHDKAVVISPFVRSRNEAAMWLYRQKPEAFSDLESFEIRPYQFGDGR